jgi:hypothetical protein
MGNWFKKMFGSKCSCDHCGHCGEKEEANKSENVNTPVAEVKTDEKVQ